MATNRVNSAARANRTTSSTNPGRVNRDFNLTTHHASSCSIDQLAIVRRRRVILSRVLKNSHFRSSRGNEAHFSSRTKASSEPPYVGCYSFNGL
jgi:hypothetical protein